MQQQTELGHALAAAIGERGPITFADYMEIALYHPQGGYYTNAQRTPQGWDGDYLTSSDLHPLFGAAIGRQLAQIWALLGRPQPFIVLEDGAGRGLLARDVGAWANAATSDAPTGFAEALHYRLQDVGTATDAAGSQAPPHVILSNELIDALPVHILERTPDGLAEVYVDAHHFSLSATGEEGQAWSLLERLGPPSTPAVAAYLERFDIDWQQMPIGWRAEAHLAAERWMADAAAKLASRGCIITIDYGDTAKRLFTRERRRGSLRCYFRHELSDEPLARTGLQDITAHVNFTGLAAVGRAHGLRQAGFVAQRDFLLALGIRDDAAALGQRLFPLADSERHTDAGQRDYLRRASLNHAISALLDPAGMGGFRVLVQQRGLPGAAKMLRGLQPISDKPTSQQI